MRDRHWRISANPRERNSGVGFQEEFSELVNKFQEAKVYTSKGSEKV
jgi:hypothetical protein